MSIAAGDKLGPYEILAPIGAGGMGEVWKARDPRLNRFVAIKILKSEQTSRFQQEARAIAALNHPHICTLHDIGPDYLVMEFLDGVPLKGPLKVEDALRIGIQICGALAAAHKRGILHRDLKPANVLVTESGAKLLDFGLAKSSVDSIDEAETVQTVDGTILGTAAYMSPEQAQGKTADERSEVFSFGAVLYEMLSGKRAFGGDSMIDVLSSVLRDDPAALMSSPEVTAIVTRCLRKNPAERFQKMPDVMAALEHCAFRPAQPQASIAVLPFANMSRDADDEYFSDGLAEEIINLLAHLPELKVIARTSAFAFKGQNTDIRKIAEVLGVTNILEGSVRRAGSRIRVTAQLITAADGSHIWSERYDRQMDDIFELQDQIAAEIAAALKIKLAPGGASRRRQPNLQAYEAYLRYRYYQWSFTPESLRQSRECLEQAIALDPEFALPYVGLADFHLSSTLTGLRTDEAMAKARDLVQHALEIEPDLAEAHAMLGIVAGPHNFDWKEAERRFRIATAVNPIPWHVRSWYSFFHLFALGRFDEARHHAERALQEDPLSQILLYCLAAVLDGLDLVEESRATYGKMLAIAPQSWWGWCQLGMQHAIHGRNADARECAEKAMAIFPGSPNVIGLLAAVLKSAGETERADELLARLPEDSDAIPKMRTYFHLARGEAESALAWAGKAVNNPIFFSGVIRANQSIFRKCAGWRALLEKMHLEEVRSQSAAQ